MAGLVSSAALFVVVAGLGAISPLPTRHAYLALASFHVWLELAVLAHCFVNGGVRGPRTVLDGASVIE
jgi:hypothetical protein